MQKEKALSQKEIDALLSILPLEGKTPSMKEKFIGSAKTYDFRSSDKFSKEQIRTLQMIHDNFARQVSSSLSAYMRTSVQAKCVLIEQGNFAEFIQSISTPSSTNILKMEPLPNRILLSLDASTSTLAVDRLLGGFGTPAKTDHQITEIEQSLIQEIIEHILKDLQEAWRNVITLDITIEEMTLNPQFAQIALPSDASVFLAFEIKVHDSAGMMSIIIPYPVLKPILTDLSPHTWVTGEAKDVGHYRDELLNHLKRVTIDISVLLGETTVEFGELLQLQKGDVLALDTNVKHPVSVMVGGCKKYYAQPGLIGNNLSVKIISATEGTING